MNILVTGARGMLGSEIVELSNKPNYQRNNYIFKDIELDITKFDELRKFFSTTEKQIDIVINCAAYTAVDDAEDEKDIAYMINEKGAENLALLSEEFDFLLIHISTDFVFDGNKVDSIAYREDDNCNPLSVYGKSKLAGEKAIIENAKEYIIFRTSWLYSTYGKNIFKTILRLSSEKETLAFVNDQVGTPTYAKDLAECILDVTKMILDEGKKRNIKKNEKIFSKPIKKIYHFSNSGAISWFDFAKRIVSLSGNNCSVSPVATSNYKTKATRPKYSVLDKTKITTELSLIIKHWEQSLIACYKKMDSK